MSPATLIPILLASIFCNFIDIYQVNCTNFSAFGADDDAYLAARTIQLFAPGIPQVYYAGMLAGENDIARVEATKNGRDINRHKYSLGEIERDIERPVAQRLLNLMAFRNTYPAFGGNFVIQETADDVLAISRHDDPYRVTARIDLKSDQAVIEYYDAGKTKKRSFQV